MINFNNMKNFFYNNWMLILGFFLLLNSIEIKVTSPNPEHRLKETPRKYYHPMPDTIQYTRRKERYLI